MSIFQSKKTKERIDREKSLIDAEVAAYKRDQLIDAKYEIQNAWKDVIRNKESCAEQLGEQEHDFHSEKEKRGIELAQIKAEVANLTDAKNYYTKFYSEQVKIKDEEIKRQKDIIDNLIKKIGTDTHIVNVGK